MDVVDLLATMGNNLLTDSFQSRTIHAAQNGFSNNADLIAAGALSKSYALL